MVAVFAFEAIRPDRRAGSLRAPRDLGQRFQARVRGDWRAALAEWAPLSLPGETVPFQRARWLATWYEAFAADGNVEPAFVEVATLAGDKVMALPLVRVTGRSRVTIEFADFGITDYNFPLLGPAAPTGEAEAVAAVAALRAALPRADVLALEKMPRRLGAAVNPLTLALDTAPSDLAGNVVTLGDDHPAWFRGLDKHYRKELERYGRVFGQFSRARFVRAGTADEAMAIHLRLEAMQRERFQRSDQPYRLDEAQFESFYRALLRDGHDDASVVVTALMVEDRMIAGLYSIVDGKGCAMVRMGVTQGPESKCSPGRLLIERTIHALHGEGLRVFDLTIGDYLHKRGFSPTRLALCDARVALSPFGLPACGLWKAKAMVKAHPRLARGARRLMRSVG